MEFVSYKSENFIGVLTINRPNALNALNSQVLNEINEAFDKIDLNNTRVVVITGAGEKSFVEAEKFGKKGNDVFRKIETFPIPVIAAINGFALGGGCELAMSCDIRVCSENALFGQPEVGLGITPGFGGTQRLARLVGLGKAKELIYAANNIKAEEALKIGLVNHVYPLENLMEETMKLAGKIAKNAPIAVRASKKAINTGIDTDMDRAIIIEQKLFASCFETEDQTEAMKAFLEKRKVEGFKNK